MLRLLLCYLFALPLALSAQSYLNATSQWQFRGGAVDFVGTAYLYDHRVYLDGDTAIAGQSYSKMYYDRQDTIYDWVNGTLIGYDTTLHTYYGAIREEPKKFYFYYPYGTQEILIQDFNLQLGDTIHWSNCYYPVTVTAIDTVFLGTTPLKRFFLNDLAYEFILEGVGATSGFRIGCPGEIGIESNLDPVCYSRDGHTISLVAGSTACGLTSATQTPRSQPLLMVPNPSGGLVHLGLPATPTVVQVFNAHGEEVWRKVQPSGDAWLDLSILPGGLYFLTARQAAAVYSGKLMLLK